jgi:hypothetical protein
MGLWSSSYAQHGVLLDCYRVAVGAVCTTSLRSVCTMLEDSGGGIARDAIMY